MASVYGINMKDQSRRQAPGDNVKPAWGKRNVAALGIAECGLRNKEARNQTPWQMRARMTRTQFSINSLEVPKDYVWRARRVLVAVRL